MAKKESGDAESHVYCGKEKEITKIMIVLEEIQKDFYGNGREGIYQIIPKIQAQLETLVEKSSANATTLSALAKTITEDNVIREYKKEGKDMNWKKASIIISAILGFSGIVITVIDKFIR